VTTIRFSLATERFACLAVYDLSGRRMRILTRETLPAGQHEYEWDGTDESGRRLASGVYFYKLAAEDYAATGKLVLIK